MTTHLDTPQPSRRDFLILLAYWMGWASLGVVVLQWLSSPRFRPRDRHISLGAAADYAPGSMTYLERYRTWLIRDTGGFYALKAVCTHLGCTPRVQSEQFVCPCHGSRFNRAGQVQQGPATRSLERLHLQKQKDQVILRPQISYRQENGGWTQKGAYLPWPTS